MSALPLSNALSSLAPPSLLDLAALPGRAGEAAVWRATDISAPSCTPIASGWPELDVQLGGGWPSQGLTELLLPQAALCEWRLLAPALQQLVAAGGTVYLIGPPKRPHAPGLAQSGIPADHLVWIAADTPQERLWTAEQLAKAGPKGAIIAWLSQARADQLRRLQVHATGAGVPLFVIRSHHAQREASPAPLRVLVSLASEWHVRVEVLKRRGGQVDQPLVIQALPGRLADVLPPRLLRDAAEPPSIVSLVPASADTEDAELSLGDEH